MFFVFKFCGIFLVIFIPNFQLQTLILKGCETYGLNLTLI
jgi:hypothetical protein